MYILAVPLKLIIVVNRGHFVSSELMKGLQNISKWRNAGEKYKTNQYIIISLNI